jgi:hypothetical protein
VQEERCQKLGTIGWMLPRAGELGFTVRDFQRECCDGRLLKGDTDDEKSEESEDSEDAGNAGRI